MSEVLERVETGKLAILSGNEAIARGAWEAGVKVAAAYPGTPSTEIVETLSKYPEVYSEWSVNEKVALEVALGAAISGSRALYASKHVGLNVAADPLFSAAYTGVRAGLVVVTADDPGMHSSQNEQDNRFYALSAKLPLLVPSDSQEAKDMTKLAFKISEDYDIPVLLRSTTRLSHSKAPVTLEDRVEVPHRGYEKNPSKYLVLPMYARKRRVDLEERLEALRKFSNTTHLNYVIEGEGEIGVIADGVAFQYAKEVFQGYPILKLGMPYPFPDEKVLEFLRGLKRVYVVEETDPFIEILLRALLQRKDLKVEVLGKGLIGERGPVPKYGELSVERLRKHVIAYEKGETPSEPSETSSLKHALKYDISELPARPPMLCPGCTHRSVFWYLGKYKNVIITGDIGCYTLGALPPLNAMETCVDMGASITMAHGIEKSLKEKGENKVVVAVIGDSTFYHSGVTGLINAVYNKSKIKVVILDNSITAMTGHQEHPGTGLTAKKEETVKIDLEKLVKAIGVEKVIVVDPYNMEETKRGIAEMIRYDGLAVLIAKRPCPLYIKFNEGAYQVDNDKCIACGLCISLGCPAIYKLEDGKAAINELLCVGCDMCAQICPVDAIHPIGRE